MLVDARLLPENTAISTEVCIIGSGPAGISLAREFIGQGTQVCLLESGGVDFNPDAQSLSDGITVGDPFLSPQSTRHRQFGGNSNIWSIKTGNGEIGVRYVPLSEVDFEARDWVPHSGWAFSKAHLDPFYERAQAICQAGPYAYEPEFWQSEGVNQLPLSSDRLITSMFQFGPKKVFHEEYRDELSQADNITIYVNATVTEIEANETVQTATRIRVVSSEGKPFWVEAKAFVLAQGGMENARLLLLSNRQQPAGLGNEHDLVGRFFMDHPLINSGVFIPSDPDWFNRMALYDLRRVNGFPGLGHLSLSKAAMQREELLNVGILLFPRASDRQSRGVASFKEIAETFAQTKKFPPGMPQHLWNTVQGIDYVMLAAYLAATQNQSLLHGFGRGGWSELPRNQRRFQKFELFFQTEQAPNPANRIALSQERDRFGNPKLELNWKWRDIDCQSVVRTQDIVAEEIARAGLGRYIPDRDQTGFPNLCSPSGVAHHLGTTRMHVSPRQGVVNADCRVHSLSNLYIAGSSTFPTGGYANPTLTIVALSLRLADHLKHVLKYQAIEVA